MPVKIRLEYARKTLWNIKTWDHLSAGLRKKILLPLPNQLHKPMEEVIIVKAADEGSTVAGKAMSGSPSSSRFETDISSVQSGETSDDEESENVTPEMARKIVDNLLAEYTTLHV